MRYLCFFLVLGALIAGWALPGAAQENAAPPLPPQETEAAAAVHPATGPQALLRLENLQTERLRILAQRDPFGSWEKWKQSLGAFRSDLRALLKDMQENDKLPLREMKGGYLFSTADPSYLLADSFLHTNAPSGADKLSNSFSIIVDLNEQLKRRGIDLIFVPIPPRSEMMPATFSTHPPESGVSAAPQRAEFMLALLDADVEVIDLYPGLAQVQRETEDTLSLKLDSHWNHLGIAEGARQVAERLKRYDFVSGPDASRKKYHTKTIETRRQGNLVGHLPENERIQYPPTMWTLDQVVDEADMLYEDDEESPILITGDSYTYVLADDHAGISAHIAKEIGMPIARLSNPRGGPSVPRALARQGKDYIDKRRVIVWMMVARYLTASQAEEWQAARLP